MAMSIDVAAILASLPADLNDPGVDRWGGGSLAWIDDSGRIRHGGEEGDD